MTTGRFFSAVFSDYFLFDRIVAATRPGADERARDYLARLHLDHKVSIAAGEFSTTQLSQGQRKRLALLCAYLEDRPFYVFDEWAADQDPVFRKIFYLRLLPELKRQGKTVLAITHDDRYFAHADRVNVAPQDGVHPHGGAFAKRHVPQHLGGQVHIATGGNLGQTALVTANHMMDASLRSLEHIVPVVVAMGYWNGLLE